MNYLGTYTLFKKESWRFLKVYNQTLIAPVITSLLFLAIFQLAIGKRVNFTGEVSFAEFMASGLIMMTVLQQSFANTSSSLIMGKVIGNIIDLLMPPISAGEMILAMVSAAVMRGLLVALLSAITISFFVPLEPHSILIIISYVILSSIMMALLGLLSGIFAESFDQMAAVTSYVITPLAFLSGTFYSINNLPSFWQEVVKYNPFFYMIDGFRFGMTGYSDADIETGLLIIFGFIAVLWLVVYKMIASGYRLKT